MRNIDYQDDQKVFSFINEAECKDIEELIEFLIENDLPLKERWAFYVLGKKNISKSTIQYMSYKTYDTYGGYYCGEIYHWASYLKNENEKKEEIEYWMRRELFDKLNETKIEIHQKELHEIDVEIEELKNKLNPKIKKVTETEEQQILPKIKDLKLLSERKIEKFTEGAVKEMKNYKIPKEEVHKRFIKEGWKYVENRIENDVNNENYKSEREYEKYLSSLPYDDNVDSQFCEACQQSPCMCSDREKTSLIHDF